MHVYIKESWSFLIAVLGVLSVRVPCVQEATCTVKDGWCVPDIQEKCRAILASYVRELMKTESAAASPHRRQDAAEGKGSVDVMSAVSRLTFVEAAESDAVGCSCSCLL